MAGADAIRNANGDLVIVIGGPSYATDLTFLYDKPFDRAPYNNKVVWEFHVYSWTWGDDIITNCDAFQDKLGSNSGYLLAEGKAYTGPVWFSGFGWAQNGASSKEQGYYNCLVQYLEGNDADWAYWALQGDYYVRGQTVNLDETFGLLNGDWSGWRNEEFKSIVGKMMDVRLGP